MPWEEGQRLLHKSWKSIQQRRGPQYLDMTLYYWNYEGE